MLFLEDFRRAWLLCHGVRSRPCQRAFLVYHSPKAAAGPRGLRRPPSAGRISLSRLEARGDVVGRGLGRLDELSDVHARHLAVLLERATGDEHPRDVLGLAVEDDLGDRRKQGAKFNAWVSMTMTSACLPGVKEPIWCSMSSTSAPPSVAARSTSATVGDVWASSDVARWRPTAARIVLNMSVVSLVPPSSPRPMRIPAACRCG